MSSAATPLAMPKGVVISTANTREFPASGTEFLMQ